jgi:hypothetical protein
VRNAEGKRRDEQQCSTVHLAEQDLGTELAVNDDEKEHHSGADTNAIRMRCWPAGRSRPP